MTKKKRGLGRGLSALIPDEPQEEIKIIDNQGEEKIISVNISDIKPNANQPRQSFNNESLKELSESIEKVGLIQPIVVKKDKSGYEIIAGERRFRAAKLIGLDKVPCILRSEDERKSTEMALVENIQREDLNSIEEAIAYDHMLKKHNLTQEELSEIVGKSRTYISNLIRLLNLSDKVKSMIKKGQLSSGHGRTLLSISDKEKQYNVALSILENDLSVRETEKLVKELQKPKQQKPKKEKKQDPLTKGIEENLRKILGTKVTINKGKKKSKIEIEYYNDEDLDRILELLDK
ncbi:ParB/RepB/Spo0J family partition protein [Clostridium sp. D2Q-11]|uniref:ParB/RepB/Spo0J family partition protein n=1 Tax=Anaeromonas frigoriresistens TaxID=2683708 RepID=A0A942Z813_9FIRM|nr:ParB/RepB/Spo0J family partition protein [Anaeromonas frigoriresistens]MBS4539302.1 ParB/RepB/Spo0J family partition protein [Anaeromonas frigoriresistens]